MFKRRATKGCESTFSCGLYIYLSKCGHPPLRFHFLLPPLSMVSRFVLITSSQSWYDCAAPEGNEDNELSIFENPTEMCTWYAHNCYCQTLRSAKSNIIR